MSHRRLRNLLLVLLVGGVGYWAYRTRPTVSGLVDQVTRPLFQSKAASEESQHKRVEAEAAHAVTSDWEIAAGMVRDKMTTTEVRQLLGWADRIESFQQNGKNRVRWTYDRDGRTVVFEDGRVVSTAIR